ASTTAPRSRYSYRSAMLSSSRITSPKEGSAISSRALSHAFSAAAISRARSCVSHVKPSPIVCHSTWSPKPARASFSPVCQAPLMNCPTPTRRPWASILSARPKAAVDLPLPGPVLTIRRPFSIFFSATSASCTALRLAILALWRSASLFSISRMSFYLHRQACGHEDDAVGLRRDLLVEAPRRIAEAAGECVFRHDAEPHLVGDDNPGPARFPQRLDQPAALRLDIPFRQHH